MAHVPTYLSVILPHCAPFVPIPSFALSACERGSRTQFAGFHESLLSPFPGVHIVNVANFFHTSDLSRGSLRVGIEDAVVATGVIRVIVVEEESGCGTGSFAESEN